MKARPNAHQPQGMRAAIYVRVSSEEQVQGYSLAAQERAADAYCQSHGWRIVNVYRDEARSARTDDVAKRPAFKEMLTDAQLGQFDILIVHKLDRFARNLRMMLEMLDRLESARVGFVSISEQMDFTSPIGKVILATLAAFAQYYSDNLSSETKKGKAERKAQGLYNGLLPFGVKKNSAGIPVPDPETYPGLLLAFQLAAEGKSDRDVAQALNAAGYRTTGNRSRNPFTKDTVCRLLQNRFFLGELPGGSGDWIMGAHEPVLDDALFDRAQQARRGNRTSRGPRSVPSTRRHHALSGLGVCGHCGGKLHIKTNRHGRARIYCYRGNQGPACAQRSVQIAGIESQVRACLATFHLPDETVTEVIQLYNRATDQRDHSEDRRREIANRRERIRELDKWGELTKEAYAAERDQLESELGSVSGTLARSNVLAQAATFLHDLPAALDAATPKERNAFARLVFQAVEITDDRVVAVVPQPDFTPFFVAQAEGNGVLMGNNNGPEESEPSSEVLNGRKRRGSDKPLRYLPSGAIFIAEPPESKCVGGSGRSSYQTPRRHKLTDEQERMILHPSNRTLRKLAHELGVSHETIRAVRQRRQNDE